jgi:amidase
MSSLTFASAHQLARMIRDRQVSALEVLDAYLTQIAKHNSQLNAICTLDEDNARTRARLADEALARGENRGALHGVPITIKDIFETAGLRTTAGYIPLKDYVPQHDATAVARLRAAGAVIMGKTNMAELAADYQSTNSLFPRINNPGMYGFVQLRQPLRLPIVPLGVPLTLMADPILMQSQTELTPCLLILADILPW